MMSSRMDITNSVSYRFPSIAYDNPRHLRSDRRL